MTYTQHHGMTCRSETRDQMIVEEVLVKKCYRRAVVDTSDVVMDIGGNIGAAARFFREQGAHVISFEPDHDNATVFRINEPSVPLTETAVCGHDGVTRLFSNTGANKAMHTVIERGGAYVPDQTVPAVTLMTAVRMLDRAPTVIKYDIEGGEYLIDWTQTPDTVRLMVFEVHAYEKRWREGEMHSLVGRINDLGFHQLTGVTVKPYTTSKWPKTLVWGRQV